MRSHRPSFRDLSNCDQNDIALKSFFLGPQGENIDQVHETFAHLLTRWAGYRRGRFPSDGLSISPKDQVSKGFREMRKHLVSELETLLDEFETEVPKFSPRYLGHMLSDISLPALYGAMIALFQNPNNVSSEASRVGLQIEERAIRSLCKMVGYPRGATGHFTSCGTIANFEAALRARESAKVRRSLVLFLPRHAHYSWPKIAQMMGFSPEQIRWIDLDDHGRLNPESLSNAFELAKKKRQTPFLTVSVFGTTEFGICDPIDEVQKVISKWRAAGMHTWHHIDAAYGGFFASLRGSRRPEHFSIESFRALKALPQADSITIDPHKLGYLPYACGSFLCRTEGLYQMPEFKSPYLSLHSHKHHLWTIEGSRSAAGAIGIYLTEKSLGLTPDGFGRIVKRTLIASHELRKKLEGLSFVRVVPASDLNLLSFALLREGELLSEINRRSLQIHKQLSASNPHADFFLTKTVLDRDRYPLLFAKMAKKWKFKEDVHFIQVLRVCLMNFFITSKEPRIRYLDEFVASLAKLAKLRA